ncbi:uncharacterized protein LOC128723736 [Anopheles nili]|uniref:uncharacterized protein LOC128723736 n=1 Tax=Anopheles nili TaxID=185578 RepID=UPI00237A9640|nr:uncharacterized protein LOC128723736 [Anopheles nili]
MLSFCGSLLLLLLCQDALGVPRPDFGLDGTVLGSVEIKASAHVAGTSFDAVDEKTITISSHYTRLRNLLQALTAIGGDIATSGQTLTAKLETLAPSKGPLPTVFSDVTEAIGTLRTLLQTGLGTQTTAIQQAVGNYITDMLTDATSELLVTLATISTQIDALQTGVNNAVAAYGAGNIPTNVIRRYVSPKVIYELERALVDLNTRLPLVKYIIGITLQHLSAADDYITAFMRQTSNTVFESLLLYDTFRLEVLQSASDASNAVIGPILAAYTQQTQTLDPIIRQLPDLNSYVDALQPVFDYYDNLLKYDNQIMLTNKLEKIFTDFLASVVTLDDHIDEFYDAKLCAPVQNVLQVLIASGPWAEYCFSKYSARVYDLVTANTNRFTMCYQLEAIRLERLRELVDRLVRQIVYDIEDFGGNISTCYSRGDTASDCVATIGPFNIDLINNLTDKLADLMQLLKVEMAASYSRMAACVSGGKCELISSAETIVTGVLACENSGPKV